MVRLNDLAFLWVGPSEKRFFANVGFGIFYLCRILSINNKPNEHVSSEGSGRHMKVVFLCQTQVAILKTQEVPGVGYSQNAEEFRNGFLFC